MCITIFEKVISSVQVVIKKNVDVKLIMLMALILASQSQSLRLLSIEDMKKGFSS